MNAENQSGPLSPPDKGLRVFLTERLQLAIFLHATGRLVFIGCQPAQPRIIQFVFQDPEAIGDQLELDFDRGAAVPATAIFASQKFLRRKMSEKLNIRNNGEFINGNSN